MRYIKQIYLAIIFLFLYAPIGVLIAQSFNASRYRGHWTGITFDWYVKLFNDERLAAAISNTLSIGLLSALIATILGLITCVGMKELSRKWRVTFMSVTNIPILNADIVTGISLMLLFLAVPWLGAEAWLRVDSLGAYRLQRAVCNPMHNATTHGARQKFLRSGIGLGRVAVQSVHERRPARIAAEYLCGIFVGVHNVGGRFYNHALHERRGRRHADDGNLF